MANGKARGRIEAGLGIIGLLALGISAILISGWNPLPGMASGFDDWVARTGALSRPEPAWTERLGDQPTAASVAGRAIVMVLPNAVEARDIGDGRQLWRRDADWAATAGPPDAAVVVAGKRKGFDVVDPVTGTQRWQDTAATAVWTYQDAVLSLTCPDDCVLTSRAPRDGAVRWTSKLSGVRRLSGVNPDLPGAPGGLAGGPVPPVLGFPLEQKVQAVDTGTGARLRQEGGGRGRVLVSGGHVLISTATQRGASCRYTIVARDPATGRAAWTRDGYDLGTASGSGCEQRRDPLGGSGVLVATRGDNRAVLLSARDGAERWVGEAGDTVVATDGRAGVVRSADQKSIRIVDLASGGVTWQGDAAPKSRVSLTPYAVVVTDVTADRLVAYDRGGGRRLVDLRTQATVLASGPTGLVLARGRTVGHLPFTPPV